MARARVLLYRSRGPAGARGELTASPNAVRRLRQCAVYSVQRATYSVQCEQGVPAAATVGAMSSTRTMLCGVLRRRCAHPRGVGMRIAGSFESR